MAEDGRGSKKKDADAVETKAKRQQGGFRTMPFILANDFCDRLASVGFTSNLISYLTLQLHLPLVQASNIITNYNGTANLTPLVGGLIADSFAGRFWTITFGSFIYQLGMVCLTLSAVLPSLHPPPCAKHAADCQRASAYQISVLYLSLLCTSIGTGGTRPCTMAFGADQLELDAHRHRGAKKPKWSFFNLYFFAVELAKLAAVTVVVYIQDNLGWGWGLGVPTMAMLAAVIAFVSGYSLYVRMPPAGSPLVRLAQVAAAAFKKRKAVVPDDPRLLYQDKELDAGISTTGRLVHTDQLKCFDKAAIVTDGDVLPSGQPDLWRLSTVHRVEELKSIIRILPICAAGIILVTSASHNHSFAIQQARTMDRSITPHFKIPPASMLIFTNLAMLLTLALYDRVLVRVLRRFTGRPNGITHLQRTGVGLTIAMLSNAMAALVERKRKSVAAASGLLDAPKAILPISVFWLVPQYAIHGVANAFMDVGRMEFLYDQAPESMRSTAAALYWLTFSMGSYLGTLLVTIVHEKTQRTGQWLPDNLNRGKLDNYYWLVVVLEVVNLIYFFICVKYYTFKPLEMDSGEEVELYHGNGNGTDDAKKSSSN
ncbi:hypothetical protein U9M48_043964 [Paspalum notatum var. saurae]|uniref:NPF family transporter n=1 Tax=Paspalum notatum var. saurae TaxID=547442 RepID=A0AAQ3UU19_PASNO